MCLHPTWLKTHQHLFSNVSPHLLQMCAEQSRIPFAPPPKIAIIDTVQHYPLDNVFRVIFELQIKKDWK